MKISPTELFVAGVPIAVRIRRRGRKVAVNLVLTVAENQGKVLSQSLAVILETADEELIHHSSSPEKECVPLVTTSGYVGSAETTFEFPVHPHTNLRKCIVVFRSDWGVLTF